MNWVRRKFSKMKVDSTQAATAAGGGVALGVLAYFTNLTTLLMGLAAAAGVMLLTLLVRAVFKRRAKAQAATLQKDLAAEHDRAVMASPGEQRAAVEVLRKRFDDAVSELEKAGKSIYDLPWLLLIGEPQSGKSMTLRGSEIHFPVGTDRLSGLGGTRNCDWWFGNEAIILDTAGRLTFQTKGTTDEREWEGFLQTLARKRRHCPINGVLLVVPVDKLLNDPPEVRKDKAKNIHARLGQLQHHLGVRFPVFLLLTKCDLILGFSETFRAFGDERAAQMVGWSNAEPFDQAYDPERFSRDFEGVYRRLAAYRMDLIRKASSIEERGLIYGFPEEFRALRQPLQQYFNVLFAPDIYHDPLFFRGFYFTSGVQEGSPIVNVAREFLIGSKAAQGTNGEFDALGKLFTPRPFFCADAYKAKALRETRMVFHSKKEINRGRRRKRWVYAGGGATAAALLTLLGVSAWNVRRFIEAPEQVAGDAEGLIKNFGQCDNFVAMEKDKKKEDSFNSAEATLNDLHKHATDLAKRTFWFRIALPFGDPVKPAEHLRYIHDQLFLRVLLRRRVCTLESTLVNSDKWCDEKEEPLNNTETVEPNTANTTKSTEDSFKDSTREYFQWYLKHELPNDQEGRDKALRSLLAPVCGNDLSGCDEIKNPWKEITEAPTTGTSRPAQRWAALSRTESGDKLKEIIKAAEAFLAQKYANGNDPKSELGLWNSVYNLCKQASDRWDAMLTLRADFDGIKTTSDYDKQKTRWSEQYDRVVEDPKNLSFSFAVNRLREARRSLKDMRDGNPSDLLLDSDDIPLPATTELSLKWYPFLIHHNDSHPALMDIVTTSTFQNQDDIVKLLKDVNRNLDKLVDDFISKLRTNITDCSRVCTADYKIDPDFAMAVTVLGHLNSALITGKPDKSGIECIAHIASFLEVKAHPKLAEAETLLEAKKQSDPQAFDKSNVFQNLQSLRVAVAKKVHLYMNYDKLHWIEAQLKKEPSLPFRLDLGETWPGPTNTEWKDLTKKDHASTFNDILNDTAQVIKKADTLNSLQDSTPDALVGTRVTTALQGRIKAYVQAYFRDWNNRFQEELPGKSSIVSASKWSIFKSELEHKVEGKEQGIRIAEIASRRLAALKESVIDVLRDKDHDGNQPSLLESILKLDSDTYSSIRTIFGREIRTDYWDANANGNADRTASDHELRKFGLPQFGRNAFEKYYYSVRNTPVPLGKGPISALNTTLLDNLPPEVKEIRIVNQLIEICKRGDELLDQEFNEELKGIIDQCAPRPTNGSKRPFPFELQTDNTTPSQLNKVQFVNCLQLFKDYDRKMREVHDSAKPTKRQDLLKRVLAWYDFVFAERASGRSKSLADIELDRSESKKTFEIRTTDSQFNNRVGTHAGVVVSVDKTTSRLALQSPGKTLRGCSEAEDKAEFTWKPFAKVNTEFALACPLGPDPGAVAPVPIPNTQLKDVEWALPMFIHTWRTSTTNGNPQELKIPIGNDRFITIEIEIKECSSDCAVPEMIGELP